MSDHNRKNKISNQFLTLTLKVYIVQYKVFEILQISAQEHIFPASWKNIINIIMMIENFKYFCSF